MSDIQQAVREKYGAIAASVTKASTNTGCCMPAPRDVAGVSCCAAQPVTLTVGG